MGKSSQRKGRAAEIELSRILQSYGYEVLPGEPVSFGEVPDLSGLPGIHCEVKRCEKLHIPEWMAQAERDAEKFKDGAPVIFHRRNREEWRCTMKLSTFMELYQAAQEGEKDG